MWRLQDVLTDEEEISKDMLVPFNQTIKKVSEDYEAMKFNTAIAQMMTLVNLIGAKGSITKGELRMLLLLLSPVSPHICEEMWAANGFGEPLHHQPWPAWDENYLTEDMTEIAVQINGKVKARLMVPTGMTREEGMKELPEREEVIKLVAGREIVKAVYVPGRLFNLVVK